MDSGKPKLQAGPIIAIIPARGGSKGIPRKNITPILGKPLIAYSIEHALQTPCISRVFVSTDDAEIAAVARAHGAEVINRPLEISGDDASSESALLHSLDVYHQTVSHDPALIVFLQATSPMRQPGAVSEAIATLEHEEADSLFSAGPLHAPVWRTTADGVVSLNFDYRNRQRRQDAPEDLVENGSIYVFRPWVLRECGNRLGGRIAVYRMSALHSFQVDTPDDFTLIEQLMLVQENPQKSQRLAEVRLLALDFDGVMTDNRVYVDQKGDEAVLCNRSDGWGLARLQEAGIGVVVISSEANPVVRERCRKLGIECFQNCEGKLAVLAAVATQKGLAAAEVAYVGNDANDLDCLAWAGVPIVVKDAEPIARHAAQLITTRCGGYGAVREVCEWILTSRKEVSANG